MTSDVGPTRDGNMCAGTAGRGTWHLPLSRPGSEALGHFKTLSEENRMAAHDQEDDPRGSKVAATWETDDEV